MSRIPTLPALRPAVTRPARRGRSRAGAALALLGAAALIALTVQGALPAQGEDPRPVRVAAAPAWTATAGLSSALDALEPGAGRATARQHAREAVAALRLARSRVIAAPGDVAAPEARPTQLAALWATERWADAVGSTLADPGSPRRAGLPRLAKAAMAAHATAERSGLAPARAVGGTGHLLAATG